MEGFILGILDPYASFVVFVALAVVVLMRKSIRKQRIVVLLVVTVTSFIAFFALLLWSFTWDDDQMSAAALQGVLKLLAAATVGCGAAIGFSFILKSLGLATIAGDPPRASSRRGR